MFSINKGNKKDKFIARSNQYFNFRLRNNAIKMCQNVKKNARIKKMIVFNI